MQLTQTKRNTRTIQRFRWASCLLALSFLLPAAAFGWATPSGLEQPALAYIDPGSGSFMIQALVAMVAGIAVTGRLYWAKIRSMLGIARSEDEDEDSLPNDD